MCKLHNCLNNDCYDCKRRAEKAKPKYLKRTPIKKKVYKIKPRSTKRASEEREYGSTGTSVKRYWQKDRYVSVAG